MTFSNTKSIYARPLIRNINKDDVTNQIANTIKNAREKYEI